MDVNIVVNSNSSHSDGTAEEDPTEANVRFQRDLQTTLKDIKFPKKILVGQSKSRKTRTSQTK